ncbi:MAG: DUF4388 domain-containing protein [Verrucomicrobia bacterium]|nr:DUF4388 domain-containing protein [Verrucomicrobiota bacterium]
MNFHRNVEKITERLLLNEQAQQPIPLLCLGQDENISRTLTASAEAVTPHVRVSYRSSIRESERFVTQTGCRNFVVASPQVSDGDAYDFLANAKMAHPDAEAFVVGDPPVDSARLEALGIVLVLMQPRRDEIIAFLKEQFRTAIAPSPGLIGSLQITPLTDLVQIKCLQQRVAALRLRTANDLGYVFFDRDGVVHSHTTRLAGEEAFFEMSCWSEGTFEEIRRASPQERTIHRGWEQLVVKATMIRDERADLTSKQGATGQERVTTRTLSLVSAASNLSPRASCSSVSCGPPWRAAPPAGCWSPRP